MAMLTDQQVQEGKALVNAVWAAMQSKQYRTARELADQFNNLNGYAISLDLSMFPEENM